MPPAVTIAQIETPSEIAAVRDLLREYTTWAFTLEERSDQAPAFHRLEEELATLPGIYSPPAGRMLLASYDGRPAGCFALRRLDAATGELKRLYVRPEFRGLKIGEALVAAVLTEARAIGYRRLLLDSHASMTKAHELYEAAGLRRIAPPPDFPEAMKSKVVFMAMDLA